MRKNIIAKLTPLHAEVLVQDVIARLQQMGATSVRELEDITKNVVFSLPKSLTIIEDRLNS